MIFSPVASSILLLVTANGSAIHRDASSPHDDGEGIGRTHLRRHDIPSDNDGDGRRLAEPSPHGFEELVKEWKEWSQIGAPALSPHDFGDGFPSGAAGFSNDSLEYLTHPSSLCDAGGSSAARSRPGSADPICTVLDCVDAQTGSLSCPCVVVVEALDQLSDADVPSEAERFGLPEELVIGTYRKCSVGCDGTSDDPLCDLLDCVDPFTRDFACRCGAVMDSFEKIDVLDEPSRAVGITPMLAGAVADCCFDPDESALDDFNECFRASVEGPEGVGGLQSTLPSSQDEDAKSDKATAIQIQPASSDQEQETGDGSDGAMAALPTSTDQGPVDDFDDLPASVDQESDDISDSNGSAATRPTSSDREMGNDSDGAAATQPASSDNDASDESVEAAIQPTSTDQETSGDSDVEAATQSSSSDQETGADSDGAVAPQPATPGQGADGDFNGASAARPTLSDHEASHDSDRAAEKKNGQEGVEGEEEEGTRFKLEANSAPIGTVTATFALAFMACLFLTL